MIYLKNNTETQAIYIPRQTVLGGGYIPSTKAYDKGYNDGFEDGKEQQKGKLSNLNVTENGQYEREDGWNVVNVDVPDLNGSYNEGYAQGKTDGANEQKSKLESISITENGTYNKEDGYNHIEVNVPSYEQGQADMAAKARVLEVTENGTYLSKFSGPIMPANYTVTGVYADGTKFYNYAQLNGKVFNTNIPATPATRLELWYKGDNTLAGDAWNIIIGAEKIGDGSGYQIRYYIYSNSELIFELGPNHLRYTWDENAWHHILIAKETENASSMSLWVDEVKIGDFGNIPFNPQSPFYINCIESFTDLTRNANGYFGMIKIDDTTIIPTAEGFKNVNTGELLEVVKDGGYTFTENLPIYGEGELYKTINVNVPDLNGSYDEGKTDGINEQKSKLETINITENGTYNREDGYNKIIVKVPDLNGSYDDGYEQGQADIASNAKVLNVTENGVYKTKFSDPIMPTTVTGVYADGTNFYNYAELNGKVFNTNIAATKDSRIELWWKNDGSYIRLGGIIGAQNDNIFKFVEYSATEYRIEYGYPYGGSFFEYNFTYDMASKWNHIIFSKQDGLNVNGELICEIQGEGWRENAATSNFWINAAYLGEINNNANGTFGMIKIDDVIIIPTADGFKNVNTGELLEVVQDGEYTFTKNLPTYGEGEIYKTINVNVPDLNGSYDDGYGQGKTDGINEQKSKLETINITENGTYSKEDGYNHIEVNVPTEAVSCNLEDKWVTPSMNDRDSNGFIVVRPSEGYDGLSRTVIDPKTIYYEGAEVSSQIQETKLVKPSINDLDVNGYIVVMPSKGYAAMGRVVIDVSTIKSEWTTIGKNSITDYDITAFTYKVYDWTSVNINKDNMTNDCGDRPLDCLLFRNRSGECTVMTKLDNCSGTARLENGWSGDSIILSLKSNSVTKFSSNSINSNQLTSIDTGFAKLEGNAITNCNALTDIKVTVLNDDLSTQFAANCFNGLPAEGTITISKNVDVTITITDDEITSFFRTIVGEGWTITIKQ